MDWGGIGNWLLKAENTPFDWHGFCCHSVIHVNATYWYGEKVAVSLDNFDITDTPAPLLVLQAIVMSPITYILLDFKDDLFKFCNVFN